MTVAKPPCYDCETMGWEPEKGGFMGYARQHFRVARVLARRVLRDLVAGHPEEFVRERREDPKKPGPKHQVVIANRT